MKNMKAIIFTLLLVLLSPAALALVWEDPYWLPEPTSNPNHIGFGETATAASGAFYSVDALHDPVVHYRAELRTSGGSLLRVLEEHDVDISVFTGWESVDIRQADYVSGGNYLLRFVVSDSHDTAFKQLSLSVAAEPDSHPDVTLTAIPTSGPEGTTVAFTCTATGGDAPLNYRITFGDGASSTSRIVSHTYPLTGSYTATCTATDVDGDSDSASRTITITNNAPVVDLTLDPSSGPAPLTVDYVCGVSGGNAPFSYVVEFGDGSAVSTAASGSHTYPVEGDYTVTCTVTDVDGDLDSDSEDVHVGAANAPHVTLAAVPTTGPEGMTVAFVCVATGGDGALTYVISFGDGSAPVNSNTATHVYNIEGEYLPVCTVTDADGDVGSDTELITVLDNAPNVTLSASPESGEAPLSVDFVCSVVGGNAPLTFMLDFGDGTFEMASSATHVYGIEGLYVATCTVIDVDGDIGSDTVGIDVGAANSCPTLDWPGDQVVRVGETLDFTLEAFDVDGDALSFYAYPPFTAFLNPVTGEFSWTPVSDLQIGDHTAVFEVSDGVCTDIVSINIRVIPGLPGNQAPVAEFNWTPTVPEAGEDVEFISTSTDPDGDSLTCDWDFNDDGWTDSTDCNPSWVFDRPGDYPVTLTVSDGDLSDSVTHIITVTGQLNVTSIECFSPVIEDSLQSCTVHVESSHGTSVGGANARLYYDDGTAISNCITDMLTGSCLVTFAVGPVGNYTVYATAEKPSWLPDLDADPTESFTVLARRYLISNLAVYNDSLFTQEDYDFFRGEDMFVHFLVLDEFGNPAEDMVTSVALVSPPGGREWFLEYTPNADGNYWYTLMIPTTHDFLGDSQVFTFAFNFSDGSGAQMVVEVVIRNNPPVIDPAVLAEFDMIFDDVTIISLTPYESDVEDSGRGLRWSVLGVDPAVAEVSVDMDDFLTVTPIGAGLDWITLVLTDLDGDTDMIDVPISTDGVVVLPECGDGIDNDGDGLIDLADPGCEDALDDDESDEFAPQCSDGLDNDVDGLVDWPLDPGCDNSSDDDETDAVVLTECSDGVDNDGDLLVDLADPGCEDALDDDESDDPVTLPACNDGVDNDHDGLIDLADPGCVSVHDDDETDPIVLPACADGIDNDGDLLIDMADPDCEFPGDNSEEHVPECSDGADNDGDLLVDLLDPGCSGPGDDDESDDPVVSPQCHDGLDNDGDGLVDWPADPGCSDLLDDDEFDIAGNQPPVADLDLSRTYGAPTVIIDVDGSDSYDPDGSIVEHSWVMLGPDGYAYSDLHVAGEPDGFSVQFFDEGTYEVRLTVVDDEGADDTEVKFVTISSSYAQCDNGIDDDGDGNIDWPADLHCHDAADPLEAEIDVSTRDKPFRDMDDLLINRIDINGFDVESAVVVPGGYYRLSVSAQNNLDYTLEDIRVDISIQELGLRSADTLRELEPGETSTVVLNLEVPEYAEPGLYDLRVVVSNDEVRRVKYRVVAIA